MQEVDGFPSVRFPLLFDECGDARIFGHLVVEQMGYVFELGQLHFEIAQQQFQNVVRAVCQFLHPFHFFPRDGGHTREQQFLLVLEELVERSFGNAEAMGYLVHCHAFDAFLVEGLYGNGDDMVPDVCAGSGFVFVHGEE